MMKDERKTKKQLIDKLAELRQRITEFETSIKQYGQPKEYPRLSEECYRTLVQLSVEAIYILDPETKRLLEANASFLNYLGYSAEELHTLKIYDFVALDRESIDAHIQHVLMSGASNIGEQVWRRKDRTLIDVRVTASKIRHEERDIVFFVARDITERRRVEEQFKMSLKEKEVLLKEINHRTKNNLQVIFSLLNLQSRYIKDEQTLEMFKESQNRIKSMTLIHEKLYQSKDLARIDFAEYIKALTTDLFRSYGVSSNAITLKINVGGVLLGIDTAIPCGLIINELVSNSLKHAFPADNACSKGSESKGEIRIDLHLTNASRVTLIVSDNGIGFPKDFDFWNTTSLGLRLVSVLTNQLGGTVEIDRSGGTTFRITFTEQKYE